ncbi:MAG: hypothetical protein Q8W47_08300 [Candidatus Palauibacterales bacterium]|nr:hypothetical protein [Candidatus Palauibacterales bacterium]
MKTRGAVSILPALALALLLSTGALRAQASAAAADSAAAYGPENPPAPRQFRIGMTGSALLWSGSASRTPQNASAWGLDVGRRLLRYLSVRLGVAYTPERVVDGSDSTDVHGYLVEVVAEPRLALDPLVSAGVVPFAEFGLGTLVFDPARSGLPTRSQNAFVLGGGVEARLSSRWGGRLEWRHYTVQLQSLFDVTELGSVNRGADRIMASLFWTF